MEKGQDKGRSAKFKESIYEKMKNYRKKEKHMTEPCQRGADLMDG